jgi:hypothetical protein
MDLEETQCSTPVSYPSFSGPKVTNRDYHGFRNPCGFWVGYKGVRVGVATLRLSPNPYPQEGLVGFGGFLGGNPTGFPNVDEAQICLR